jgi:hypothetical protein
MKQTASGVICLTEISSHGLTLGPQLAGITEW